MRNEFRKCQGTENKLLKIATYKIQWRDNIGQTPGVVTAVPKRGTTVTEASTPHLLEEMESGINFHDGVFLLSIGDLSKVTK